MGKVEGFVAALIAAIFFGSNYIPVKKFDMGDGMYFQFIMAVGIWAFGLFYFIVQAPQTGYFHPLALLGGTLWSIGNVMTVPIIKSIGMALGISIWAATSLVVGWVLGKFGWLGFKKDTSIKTEWLNYFGLFLCIVSLTLFFFVKPNEEELEKSHSGIDSKLIINIHNRDRNDVYEKEMKCNDNQRSYKDFEQMKMSAAQKQILGIIGSVLAGICYGTSFCPIQYLINHHDSHEYSSNLEDYAFTHYCGILISSIVWFSIYCLVSKNKPQINNTGTFPAIISGVLWAVAQAGYFTAMDDNNLGPDTTFPFVAGSPQIIASIYGVVWFKEVKPGKNMLILLAAMTVGVGGIVSIALAK